MSFINIYRLRDTVEDLSDLLKRAAEGEKFEVGKNICCRTCPEWTPCEIWEENKRYTPPREESHTGLCQTHGNNVTHDRFTDWCFFCPDHPCFKREKTDE